MILVYYFQVVTVVILWLRYMKATLDSCDGEVEDIFVDESGTDTSVSEVEIRLTFT
jgi:hypothetical protein